ncbi:MAG: hypothetical protein ACE5H8_07670 [Alphaproteobacteria bacterium]
MIGRPGVQPKAQGDTTTAIFLALYLIVLAFFILLNAISEREAGRAKAALGSLGATFAEPALVPTGPLDYAAGAGAYSALTESANTIRHLFQSAFPMVEVSPYQPFRQMQVMVPVNAVFVPDGALIHAEVAGFLDQLAAVLARATPGQVFELEVLVPLAAAETMASTPARANAVHRAAAVARALTDRGVASAQLVAGIAQNDTGQMRFVFQTRLAGERVVRPRATDG